MNLNEIIKRFDKKFIDKIKNINGDFAYEELKYGEQTDPQDLRDFINSEFTSLLEKIKGEVKTSFLESAKTTPKDDEYYGGLIESSHKDIAIINKYLSK